MSGQGDVGKGSGGSRAAGGVAPSTAPGPLLAVLEPGRHPDAPAGPATEVSLGYVAAPLAAEALRLAAELKVPARLLTWVPVPDLDPGAVAAALARSAESLRAAAVLLADTDLGRQVAPMVAHRLGSGAVVGCSDVLVRGGGSSGGDVGSGGAGSGGDGTGGRARLTFVKPVYGGWLEQEIEAGEGSIPVVTIDLTAMPLPTTLLEDLPAPEVLELTGGVADTVRSLEVIPPDPSTVDLVHAKRIVTAGAGSAGDELLCAARDLAEVLEGSMGATRPVVDDGRLPKERLIGQTGRTVTPDLYFALGVSGSPHHVAGVKKAEKIVSINRDVRAPMFQFSDEGYVADLEIVLPALVAKIKEYRDAGIGAR
jgi:electron transfer flavoprotein alpha subunit